MKVCCMCKLELETSSFKSNGRKGDGLQSQCIECQKARKHTENHTIKPTNKNMLIKLRNGRLNLLSGGKSLNQLCHAQSAVRIIQQR